MLVLVDELLSVSAHAGFDLKRRRGLGAWGHVELEDGQPILSPRVCYSSPS